MNKQVLEPKYGLFTAISMVIGQVIGSGIFFKVDDILLSTSGNVLAGLFGFLIVGISVVFASMAMSSYAQLMPTEGGILAYVRYRFGESAAALVGWIYLSLFYPLLTAVLFTVSGIYISHLLAEIIDFTPTFAHYVLIGVCNAFLFLLLNIFRPRHSGIFQQITTVLKLLPLIMVAAIGVITLIQGTAVGQTFTEGTVKAANTSPLWTAIAASFIPIAFAFDGWYIATQISGEVKNSSRNLPKALILGTTTVLIVYVLYYVGITSKLSASQIITLKDNYIGEYASLVAGAGGKVLIQLFIIISVLGTSNGLLLASIRVPYQFYNLPHARKFASLGSINQLIQMPVRSAVFAFVIILIYFALYYITSTVPFFTERNFDISAIPIAFIYMVNGGLFIGLLSLIKRRIITGNRFKTKGTVFVAIFGVAIVLTGTLFSANGIFYILCSLVYVAVGLAMIKRN